MTGGVTGLSIGPLRASDVAHIFGVPVELLQCTVAGCSSPETMHHHHARVGRTLSRWACLCPQPGAR